MTLGSPPPPVAPTKRPRDWIKGLIRLFLLIAIIGCAGAIYLQQPATTVWLAAHDLPAYHLIKSSDLMTKTVTLTTATEEAIPDTFSLVAYYTHQPVKKEKIILKSHLVPTDKTALTVNTVPVPIPATAAMAFNGQLAPGAVVTLWSSLLNKTGPGKAEPLLPQALVLDVQKADPPKPTESKSLPYVIVLAIPVDQQADVITAARFAALSLVLAP